MTATRLLTVTQAAYQATAISALILFLLHGLSFLTPLPPALKFARLVVAAVCGVAAFVLLTGMALIAWRGRPTNTDDSAGSPTISNA